MLTNHFPALSVRLSAQIVVRVDYHTTTQRNIEKKIPLNFWRVNVIDKEVVQVQLDTFTLFKDGTQRRWVRTQKKKKSNNVFFLSFFCYFYVWQKTRLSTTVLLSCLNQLSFHYFVEEKNKIFDKKAMRHASVFYFNKKNCISTLITHLFFPFSQFANNT